MANIEQIQVNPSKVKNAGAKGSFKASSINFDDFMIGASGVAGAMAPTAMAVNQWQGGSLSGAVITGAFNGMASAPSFAGGSAGSMGMGVKASGMGLGGLDPNGSVIPGAGPDSSGLSQGEMIQTMNQNNLKLLELQAVMQNNMQEWNTKSNILSADNRAKMAMIEKFTAR